jgi:hypothetical protein
MSALTLFASALLIASVAAEPRCACLAKSLGFTIDCGNVAAMNESLAYLRTNQCTNACSTRLQCGFHFSRLMSHHDYCLPSEQPSTIGAGFHDFEGSCPHCLISRKYRAGLLSCPSIDCSNINPLNTGLVSLNTTACKTGCSATSCSPNFQLLRAYHDKCGPDVLPSSVEKLMHEFEGPCANQDCNMANKNDPVPTCSSGSHISASLYLAVLGSLSLLMTLVF